jgi:hypothetical protein
MSRDMAGVAAALHWDEPDETDEERLVPLESCICGLHFDCPDGWHYGGELPCSCTADCVLGNEK